MHDYVVIDSTMIYCHPCYLYWSQWRTLETIYPAEYILQPIL